MRRLLILFAVQFKGPFQATAMPTAFFTSVWQSGRRALQGYHYSKRRTIWESLQL
jgi:hypothetical protein